MGGSAERLQEFRRETDAKHHPQQEHHRELWGDRPRPEVLGGGAPHAIGLVRNHW